jgi:hypothetical protein
VTSQQCIGECVVSRTIVVTIVTVKWKVAQDHYDPWDVDEEYGMPL